ncbi:DUF4868 domain-containing protein [Serratia ureilytica]|uniref:DUF4868 domain-containing protein n=1 Tax=Serratia ureilytica TaxID=300181 RepID=A0ABU0VNE3_9GAMM|nr:DUF4868 domain-containing protein [Serratia ureilytica]MCU7064281.1 DUF4868 domain-containing protein [Serratia ureilytica]MDQ1806657.1 DUF4868 domain-containing protein [Serratia ureilytica]MDQ1835714.1 DUF4868 domain-containing protein [Serratia ureilytica]MDQ1862863.1 DUF4868 domain-containing protein [Serratia ureilytica]
MFTAIDNILNSSNVSGEAYFVTENQGQANIYRVSLETRAEQKLTQSFSNSLQRDVVNPNVGMNVLPLVSSLLSREKQVHEYDHQTINHLPPALAKMADVLNFGVNNTPPDFDFAQQELSTVKGIVYYLCDGQGNGVVVYQHKYPIALHKKTKLSYFSANGRTLTEVDHDSIDINGTVDFFYFNNKYYALNINLLERAYGLEQVINNLAANATPHIIALNVVDLTNHHNPLDIFNDMHKNRNFMRRLATTANSPLLHNGTINMANIQALFQSFPILGRNIIINQTGLIELSSQKQKMYFIRLLNNEASFSALNQEPFLAVGKDSAA